VGLVEALLLVPVEALLLGLVEALLPGLAEALQIVELNRRYLIYYFSVQEKDPSHLLLHKQFLLRVIML
jgi:hypothetical protein